MSGPWIVVIILIVIAVVAVLAGVRIVKQYELGVLFRLGRVLGTRQPGLRFIIPFVDVLPRVSLRIVTMPIQSQGSSPATTSAWTCRRWPTTAWLTR
jgi:regulator of protease activity HflC (stomatin/prohibitin superfamily)